jgi:hypothetical protein
MVETSQTLIAEVSPMMKACCRSAARWKSLLLIHRGDFLLPKETILSSEGERSLTTRGIEVRDNEGSKGLTMAALPKEEAVAVTGVWGCCDVEEFGHRARKVED